MKNLRKALSLLLCFVMVAALLPMSVLADTATEQAVEHTHMYRTNYAYDDTYHWQVCIVPSCPDKEGSIKNYDTHDYADAQSTVCETCGYEKQFNLTVLEGEGSGSYKKGTVVDIEAIIPEGWRFEQWVVVTEDAVVSFANDTSSITSLTMPGYDVTIMPVFSEMPVITEVRINPQNPTMQRGETTDFSAYVYGSGPLTGAVAWEVSGGTDSEIDADGLLTVGAEETAETLTVTVRSTEDKTKFATTTVTVAHHVYVGGIGMDNGDYLAGGATAPTAEKPAGGYAHYDNGVLTLHNYTGSTPQYSDISVYSGIFRDGDLELVISGANSIASVEAYSSSIAVWGTLTIREAEAGGSLALESSESGGEGMFASRIIVESGTLEVKCRNESMDELYWAICCTDYFSVSPELTITASTEADGELGEYLQAQHDTYDRIRIEKTAGFSVFVTDGRFPLGGAAFKLESKVVNGPSYEVTSNYDGEAAFYHVADGEYILSQTAACNGYVKSDVTLNFKVEKGVVKYLDRGVYVAYNNTYTFRNTLKPHTQKFDIAFSQIDMGNALGMNFAFPVVPDVDFTGAYVEATMAGSTQTITVDKWTTATIGGKTHFVFGYSNIAAKQMADEISIVIYNADGEAISNEYVDSIRGYVMRNVDGKDAESKALMIDMLNYGAAAQSYYKYNVTDLANGQLT